MFKERFAVKSGNAGGFVYPSGVRKIAVTGTGECVGATFIASGLCLFFARKGVRTSYTEVGRPAEMRRLMYDSLALDRRLGKENVTSVYSAVKDSKPLKEGENPVDGVFWRVITEEDAACGVELDPGETARLISTARGTVQVFDVQADEGLDRHLLDMDLIIAVADPMPSKLLRQKDRIKALKKTGAAGNRILWVVNRMNDGVSKRQVQGFLREEQILFAGEVPAEKVYTAEFRCGLVYGDREVMSEYDSIFTKISQSLGI